MIVRLSEELKHAPVSLEKAIDLALQVKNVIYVVPELYCPFDFGEEMNPKDVIQYFYDVDDIFHLYRLLLARIIQELYDEKINGISGILYMLLYDLPGNKYELQNINSVFRQLQSKYNKRLAFIKRVNANEIMDPKIIQVARENDEILKQVGIFADAYHGDCKEEHDRYYEEVLKKEIILWSVLDELDESKWEVTERQTNIELVSGTGEMIEKL